MEFLDSLQKTGVDDNTAARVAVYINSRMQDSMLQTSELQRLREAKAVLEKAQESALAGSKNVVRDVVDVISQLYAQFGPGSLSDTQKSSFADKMVHDADLLHVMQPMLVAASAIHRNTAAASVNTGTHKLDAAKAQMMEMQKQLDAMRNLSSHSIVAAAPPPPVQPSWSQPISAPST